MGNQYCEHGVSRWRNCAECLVNETEIEQLKAENVRLNKALDRIGFYCAGTELNHVSEFVLRVKNGEEF